MAARDRYSGSQRAIVDLAKDAFNQLWSQYSGLPTAEFQGLLDTLMPALVDDYGKAAATAAAEWYEETRRASIGGVFTAQVEHANLAAARGSVEWAGGKIYKLEDGLEAARSAIEKVVERHVRNTARDTITRNVRRDPAKPRWARMMRGRETCGWCRMLASRGFVYLDEETAGSTHKWHDSCDCDPQPDFSLNEAERAAYDAEVDDLYAQYLDVRSRVDSKAPTDEQISAEWTRSMLDYAQVRKELEKTRTGRFGDGTIARDRWDDYRGKALEKLEASRPDGYLGTDKFLPRNPAPSLKDWPPGLPLLPDARFTHILYGDAEGAGGHLAGMGWLNPQDSGARRSEFPAAWGPSDIAKAIQDTIQNGTSSDHRTGYNMEHVIDGYRVRVVITKRANGVETIRTAYPI